MVGCVEGDQHNGAARRDLPEAYYIAQYVVTRAHYCHHMARSLDSGRTTLKDSFGALLKSGVTGLGRVTS